jgi:Ca2+/Na+ antiporter
MVDNDKKKMIFLFSILFFLVIVNGQLNFYKIDRSIISFSPFFYDCLYYTVKTKKERNRIDH